MNIWEYLGLKKDYRTESKTTQLVKHYDEVPDSRKKDKVFGLQFKEDGVCAITIVRDGMPIIFSRTGRKFTNTSHLVHRIMSLKLKDGVYFGEMTCCLSMVSLEVLSGATNPNRVNPLGESNYMVPANLDMNFFDLVSIKSFIEGESQTPYTRRYSNLVDRLSKTPNVTGLYYLDYSTTISDSDIDKKLESVVSVGGEGIVIIDVAAGWVAGHKGWRKMKKVRGCDYDLMCIGWEEGTGKYKNKVANLIFNWKDNKTIKCMLGKGWTHQMAEQMFIEATNQTFHSPVGEVFQVYALEESSKGKLRLPKVGEQRHDKGEPDV